MPDGDDNGANECFTVNPVTPALATTAGPDVVLGNADLRHRGAERHGEQARHAGDQPDHGRRAAAGGITLHRCTGPNDCATVGLHLAPRQAVSGDGTYGPVSFTPTAVGTYHWVASYSR